MGDAPVAVAAEVADLSNAVGAVVPARTASNLVIGSWNLRAFGDLTAKWAAEGKDSPKRDWHAVALIAAVLGRFDVVAVQEVKRDTTALRFLLEQLGVDWKCIVSDVSEGDPGNDERLTFLYDSTRVQPSGLIGEIVLPGTVGQPATQFARSPYAASFTRSGVEFILTTVHIMWGNASADRLPEITAFAQWMRAWADRKGDWNTNLLVLGDFNIDRLGNPLYEAFVSTGLWPPAELSGIPRTIFDNDKTKHFYDQIAWFMDVEAAQPKSLLTGLTYNGHAGSFDYIPHVFPGLTKVDVSWRISDHYPLWVEFATT
ncbi:endonuclease/exonuclease/phosphatase family protein [Planctomonas sp. JC2975]|uniref:endonuclease/exonuclease/phosphatase family protein n=1 Tax=Planctomonas sp. JC2975 TaxID=2729626 RepID=UPI001474D0F6|nr:endonuclease/exonuclease/phosphatase family protein [Planctomonas sp. JC2975]NNC13762.1 endonuclease/exonuclease/phosphatase family protein [Planctomonas sp. JC2975]